MNNMNALNQGQAAQMAGLGQLGYAPTKEKGTAVDSVNATIESLTNKISTLSAFARRISDGIIGVTPETASNNAITPRPVTQSTQDHLRELEAAFERLSVQINRLG